MSTATAALSGGTAGAVEGPRERPIPFMGEMVRAILSGAKTQTRRALKSPQPLDILPFKDPVRRGRQWVTLMERGETPADNHGTVIACRYGVPGDRLWVREAWQYADWTEDGMPFVRYRADDAVILHEHTPEDWGDRLADIWADLSDPANYAIDNRAADRRWRSPRFMPRWASRLTLEITEVRAQRLQDITDRDAMAEGVGDGMPAGFVWVKGRAANKFRTLWDTINGDWEANPWVWAITFAAPARSESVSTGGEE